MPSEPEPPEQGQPASSSPQPPLPPPLPASGPSLSPRTPEQRLHPLSLFFTAWNALTRVLIPALILILLRQETYLGGILIIFVLVPVVLGVIRYFTFTYRVEDDELITREGVLSRTERNIPLARVQDVRVEQGLLHRLLHVVEVHVDTASGGQSAEAVLSVLTRREADRLRAAVFALKAGRDKRPGEAGEAAAPPPLPKVLRRLGTRDLVVAGLTSNHLASAAAILAILWGLADDFFTQEKVEGWIQSFSRTAEQWTAADLSATWVLFLIASLVFILIGAFVSVAGSILLFHGFTVAKAGNDLLRSYGLLTRRSSTLPLRRIQLLKIEEKPFRRLFRLATLRADTAGGGGQEQAQESKSGRDVLLPIIKRDEVESLLPEFFPDFDPGSGTWKPVSRRAILRGTMKGTLVCLLLTGLAVLNNPVWPSLWPVLLILPVYGLNVLSYRHLGYWRGGGYVRTRRGWWSRAGHVVPIRNIQSVVIRQTPFDRRHRVGTLQIDSAGQVFTGGGPQVNNIPWQDLNRLAWTLARDASRTSYRW